MDFLPAHGDFSSYPLLLLPSLYVLGETDRAALDFYVEGGGTLVVGAYSGVVDENDAVWTGGYPGALRDLLGVRMEEFVPLGEGRTVTLSDGSTGGVWRELGRTTTAEVIAFYTDDGFRPGGSGAGGFSGGGSEGGSRRRRPLGRRARPLGPAPGGGARHHPQRARFRCGLVRLHPAGRRLSAAPARPDRRRDGHRRPGSRPGARTAEPPPTAPSTCSRSITTTRRTSSWPSPAPTCSPRRTSPVRCRRAASP